MTRMTKIDQPAHGWQRVAAAMEDRAAELGWTLSRLAQETGISDTSRRAMRQGTPIKKPAKLSVLCKALGWAPDSIDTILAGGDPIQAEATIPSADEIRQLLVRIEEKVESLVQGQIAGLEIQDELREILRDRLPERSQRRSAR